MIHWQIERNEKGEPKRMHWSARMQDELDHVERAEDEERRAEEALRALPMPSMIPWARKRGLI